MATQHRLSLEGGYDCIFVDPPRELEYKCPICLCVLRDPCLLGCECGTKFCRSCITPVKERNQPCPHCQNAFRSITPDNALGRNIVQRQVFCLNKKLGCEWQGELRSLDQHLAAADDGFGVPCTYCNIAFRCSEIENHKDRDCGQRPYSCDYCRQYQSTCNDVTLNHWPVCPSRPVPCTNECGVYPERQDLVNHVDNDCPLTVVDCDFHYAGCAVRLPRKDMPDHLKGEIVAHMSLQAAHYRKEIASKNAQIEELKRQVEDNIPQQMEDMRQRVESNNEQLEVTVGQVNDRENQIQRRMNIIESQVPRKQKQLVIVGLVLVVIVAGIGGTACYHNHSELEGLKESTIATDSAHQIELQNMWEKINFADMGDQFEMSNFHKHNECGTPWISPPFFRSGYKLCLAVYTGKGNGSHLSVFVHLMRGVFDDTLQWPFRGDISVQLLNQRGGEGEHHERTISFTDETPNKNAGRVIDNDRTASGWGRMKFITLEQLNQTYLVDNRLQFRVKAEHHRRIESVQEVLSEKTDMQYTEQIVNELTDLIFTLDNETSEYLSDLYTELSVRPKFLPFNFTVEQFSDYYENSSIWYSQPFYSHSAFGYKMCLRVDCDGSVSNATYVSVYIILMPGDFDDNLEWPFRGEITILLLNQRGSGAYGHHGFILPFNDQTPDGSAGRVTESERGGGWGYTEFIPYEMLQPKYMHQFIARYDLEPQYLLNDQLHFRITISNVSF